MRVLQLNTVCGFTSAGRIASDIDGILKEKGYESYIAFGRGTPMNCDTPIRIGTKWDTYAHVVLTRIFDKHGLGSKRATREFLGVVEELDPDIIHLHNIHGYYLNVELLFDYLKVADKPVVWTLHDCWPFTGHCSHFDYIGCNKWRTQCFDCPQKNQYPSSKFLDNSKNNFSRKKVAFTGVRNMTIVSPSQWLAGLVRDSFLNEYPVKVINNGIDLDLFKPAKGRFRKRYGLEDKFVILGVTNVWTDRKGLLYFTELAGRLYQDEAIVLVGLTEKQKSFLPPNIIGIKRTNSVEELAEIYSDADVFINLTLEDNFPTTNLEALACGTPVITFDTGGSAESIDKTCGFIARQGSLDDTLNFIRIVKKNRKKVYEENCLNRARRLYDKKDRFADYISMYERILNIDE